MVVPLSLPGLATIALFSTLGYWNDWFQASLYIDNPNLVPLQSLLMKIENNLEFMRQNSEIAYTAGAFKSIPQDGAKWRWLLFRHYQSQSPIRFSKNTLLVGSQLAA